MNAVTLYRENGLPVEASLCALCERVWESKESAERCCRCSFCGQHCDWRNGVSHDTCFTERVVQMEAERLANATLVQDYSGPFLINGKVYFDVTELFDRYHREELPEFGFCVDERTPRIDGPDMIESIAEEMHEDWEAEPCEQFEEGIAAWNKANEGNGSYFECDDRKWSRALLAS